MTDHSAEARKMVTRPQIRDAFLRNGATIAADRDDLPDWVYEAAFELLELAAPAAQGEPVGFVNPRLLPLLGASFAGLVMGSDVTRERTMPLYAAPQAEELQPFEWPKLEKPAKVGGVRFGAGVSSRLVVEAAQRQYEYDVAPEKEAQRMARFDAFRQEVLQPIHKAAALVEALDGVLAGERSECGRILVNECDEKFALGVLATHCNRGVNHEP